MSEARAIGRVIIAPAALIVLAYGLWVLSDRLLYIGPLDRAAFGWAVVIPVWLLAPFAGALAARPMPAQVADRAFIIGGIALAVIAFAQLWLAIIPEQAACENGPRTPPEGWVLPMGLIALVFGGGWAIVAKAAAGPARDGRILASLVIAVGLGAVLVLVVIVVTTFPILLISGCNRPT